MSRLRSEPDDRQDEQHRELPGDVHGEVHALDQHAETGGGADELGHDGADQREDHGDVEPGHDERQGVRQPQHPEDLRSLAASERIRLTRSSSAERRPTMVLTSSGKNATSAALMTLEVSPRPNQMTMSGASATFGSDWNMTMYG